MTTDHMLFVFSLEREARAFRQLCPAARVKIVGIGQQCATQRLQKCISRQRPSAVIIAGFAGGLRDELEVGVPVMASAIIDAGDNSRRSPTLSYDPASGIKRCVVVTVDQVIGKSDEKRELAKRFSADAVDMESAALARICSQANIAWAVVRAISDTVHSTLAPEIGHMLASGVFRPQTALGALLRRSSLGREFWRLARDSRRAGQRLAIALASLRQATPDCNTMQS